MTASHKFVTISQLTSDGSRPLDSQISAALFPPRPAYLSALVEDWSPEVKRQMSGVVTSLMGWNPEPKRVLLLGPIGSGKVHLMHSAGRMAEAFCFRIQITADMLAYELERMFVQVEQHERVLIILEHWGYSHHPSACSHFSEQLAQHLDRLAGRANTVVVVATHDAATLPEELRSRFGDFKIDVTPVAQV